MNEPGVDADLLGELPSMADGPLAEVRAGHSGPETGPRQGVDAEVTLEVEEVLARDVPHLADLVVADPDVSATEPLHVVEVGADVEVRPLVPQLPVRRDVLLHGRSRYAVPRDRGHRLGPGHPHPLARGGQAV